MQKLKRQTFFTYHSRTLNFFFHQNTSQKLFTITFIRSQSFPFILSEYSEYFVIFVFIFCILFPISTPKPTTLPVYPPVSTSTINQSLTDSYSTNLPNIYQIYNFITVKFLKLKKKNQSFNNIIIFQNVLFLYFLKIFFRGSNI